MRYLLILSFILFSCSKEEVNFNNPYQLRMSWECTSISGYSCVTTDMFWTRQINLNNKIFLNIDVDYGPNARSNYQEFDIDITKLSDTTNVRVILTFDCDTATIIHEIYGLVRDGIPDHYNIKEEFLVNFYKDKRTVILVEASPVCNPEITVYYE